MLTDAVEKVPNFFAANFLPRDETRDFCSSIYPQAGCRSHWRVHRFMMRPHTIVGSLHRRLEKFQRCKKTFSTASTRCASRPTEMRNAGSHDNLLTERATTGRREMPNQPPGPWKPTRVKGQGTMSTKHGKTLRLHMPQWQGGNVHDYYLGSKLCL